MIEQTPKVTVAAVKATLKAAGAAGAVRRLGNHVVVMAEGDNTGPVFTALLSAGYTLDIEGDGDYVQSAVVTRD